MLFYPEMYNMYGERLDTIVEGKDDATATIIFVHGFGTDKHETARYFDDMAMYFAPDFRTLRFDFSGCGKSGGKMQDKDYKRWVDDLKSIVDFTKKTYPGEIHIIAQSMGCFITSMLAPDGISKAVFTGIPNNNTNFIIDRLLERFGQREGARIDMENVSILPRSNGTETFIGPTFWRVLRLLKPAKEVANFASKTKLMIVHPDKDEIVGHVFLAQYSDIPGVVVKNVHGDHSFKNREDRKALMVEIKGFLTSSGQ